MLDREYAYYKAHLPDFLKEHSGQFVVIQGETVKGFFASEDEAIAIMTGQELGSYFVKQCVPFDQTVIEYHSRAVFV
jgi:hypothetical protein